MKKIDPAVSAHMSALAKKRKNPHKFTSETAKEAARIRHAKQKSKN